MVYITDWVVDPYCAPAIMQSTEKGITMRNSDLLHMQHALRLLKRDEKEAYLNQDGDIQIGKRTISYVRMPAGNGTVGGYRVQEPLEGDDDLYDAVFTRSFNKAVELVLEDPSLSVGIHHAFKDSFFSDWNWEEK